MGRDLYYLIIISIFSLLHLGCDRPHPNPELLDPIYSDMKKQESAYRADAEAEKKTLAEHEGALKTAVPQTGQIKFAQKRYYESLARYERLKQMELYWSVRAQSRKEHAMREYLKAYSRGEDWPSQEEVREYKSFQSAQKPARQWKLEDRMAELGIDPKIKKGDGGRGEGTGSGK